MNQAALTNPMNPNAAAAHQTLDDAVHLEVTLPAGVRGGQQLKIEHAGQELTVVVPEGLSEGETFSVEAPVAPAAAGATELQRAASMSSMKQAALTNPTNPNAAAAHQTLDDAVHLEVAVPAGVRGGQQLKIEHAGQELTVVVPEGLSV